MKQITFLLAFCLFFPSAIYANQLETVIIEVEGDVEEHQDYIETYHPFIEVVAAYSTLFQGLALQGKPEHLQRMHTADFIKSVHDVQEFQAAPMETNQTALTPEDSLAFPEIPFTGKNIDVAIIDTGIDYTHPDLRENFAGGFDLFDLDEDPMETLPEEGMPTNHGTHVAGIIAADGELKGLAPNASLHAYRALGPGGFGSTLHVLAALEQAVNDRADVINLSLGNNVNGPDYPTSVAVNRAVELGIPVVIANGNSGPAPWTVGSPATAKDALSVGAAQAPTVIPALKHRGERRNISLSAMQGAPPWDLTRDYQLADGAAGDVSGKIALFPRGDVPFHELALAAQEKGAVGVLIYNNEPGALKGAVEPDESIEIPVAGLSKEDGEWLKGHIGDYLDTVYHTLDTTVADFSSRGPVTVDWQIKPDLIAFGAAITSTVPGGYEAFSGTSMAAPYVTGAVALLQEAHPDWDADKIYSALRTTAEPLTDEDGSLLAPSVQGHGLIQPEKAMDAPVIIYSSALEAGKISGWNERRTFTVKIENRTDGVQRFYFDHPKRERGVRLTFPQSFEVEPGAVEEVEIELHVTGSELPDGVHEGFVVLREQSNDRKFHLPYLFINQSAGQPKIAGLEFSIKPFSEEVYSYSLYTTEELDMLSIDLYDPDTLTYRGNLIDLENPAPGVNEGEIPRYKLSPGAYEAIVTTLTPEGEMEAAEIPLYIE